MNFHWPELPHPPDWSLPPLLGAVILWAGWVSFRNFQKGEMTLPRGLGPFYRDKQPILFWLATAVTVAYLLIGAVSSVFLGNELVQKRILASCDPKDEGTTAYYRAIAKDCDVPLRSLWASRATRQLLHDDRGFALYRAGDHRAAIDDFSGAIVIEPKDDWAFRMRGMARLRLRQFRDAATDFDAAVNLDPNNMDSLRARASLNVDMGRGTKAVPDLVRLAAAQPKDPVIVRMLAAAYSMKGDCQKALPQVEKALALGDKTLWPFKIRAECEDHAGNVPAAIASLGEALKRNPDAMILYIDRADIYFKRDRFAEAIGEMNQAIRLSPNIPALLEKRCWYRTLGNTELEEGLQDCSRAIDLAPAQLEYRETRALTLFRLGRYVQAIADCNAVLDKNPDSVTALFARGISRNRLTSGSGDADIARARDINTGDVAALTTSGLPAN